MLRIGGDVDFSRKSVQKVLYYFMQDTLDRVMENIMTMKIGTHNPKATWDTGDLERSIKATVTMNAGGDEALVNFFYLHYGNFVQAAVQGNTPWTYPLPKTDIPAMTSRDIVPRPDAEAIKKKYNLSGETRPAKPFLRSQALREAKRAHRRIGDIYIFAGYLAILRGVDDPDNKVIHSKNEMAMNDLAKKLGIKLA